MPKPENITELREQLLDAFEEIKRDPRRANQVKEMTNTAGKILSSVKCQIEYSLIRGEQPEIKFMGQTSGVPMKGGLRQIEG